MKYIKIKNTGCIEPQALHLVGASTKRNDSSKIGQFGSGNKYALAYFLRNGHEVKIFSGMNEITLETKPETFREHTFNVLWVNGEKTSITIDMGKDWQFWQAIREIYCNAIDEGGSTLDFVQAPFPCENETHFYISTNKDSVEFVGNFDNYFAHNKKVLFECKEGRILEKSGTECNVYRKGIRCYNATKPSMFDYDFERIDIDENRLVKFTWQVEERMWKIISQCTNEFVIKQIMHNCGSTDFMEGTISDWSTIDTSAASEEFVRYLKSTNIAPKGYAGLLKPDEVHTHIILPTKIFDAVRGLVGDENVGDKFKVTKVGAMFREISTSELMAQTIKEAMYFFSEVNFDIPYEIKVAIFDDKGILGCAYNGFIYLSEICTEKGVNEVCNTIVEEYIHLKYGCQDETREFQTAAITEFISYMKKVNSFVI